MRGLLIVWCLFVGSIACCFVSFSGFVYCNLIWFGVGYRLAYCWFCWLGIGFGVWFDACVAGCFNSVVVSCFAIDLWLFFVVCCLLGGFAC